MTEERGFFEALFDISFTSFVTTRLVKVIYALGIIGAAIVSLWFIGAAVEVGRGGAVVFALVFAPVLFLVAVTLTRLYLELAIVVFRIADHAAEIVELLRAKEGGAG